MIYDIKIYGDESLRKVAEPVAEINEEILEILDNMVLTMREAKGVGLAAPQVGINKRMFVIDVGDGKLRKVINPKFTKFSDEIVGHEEGCLSVPGVHKTVKRPSWIEISYTNENGEEIVERAEELLCRAFQHEYDHLEAILFVDKISPVAKRVISGKLKQLKKESEKI